MCSLASPSLTPSPVPTAPKPAPIRISCLLNSANERSNLAFLREGTVPTLANREPIYEDLDNLEVELQRVDDEIARLRALREQIRTQLALSRAMVAPVRRLTPELLARIFFEHADEYPDVERTRIAAATIAEVSTVWRWVACSVPGLWTYIPLTPIAASTYPHLEVCLSRSGSCLLHIHGMQATGTALKAQITRLLPDAHRWKTLSLHHHYNTMLPDVLTCAIPSLERATLGMAMLRVGMPGQVPFVLNFLTHAPRLHNLTLTAYATYEIHEEYEFTIPTSCALTALSLETFSCEVRSVLPLIRQCAGTLQRLSLLFTPFNNSAFRVEQRIEMPRLKSINIGASACRFLYDLRTPRLAAITMPYGPYSLDSMLEYFAKGGACPHTIRDLHLMYFNPNQPRLQDPRVVQRLLQFLQILGDLSTLTMDIGSWAQYTSAFVSVEVVVSNIASAGLLPSLTKIAIHTDGHPAPSTLQGLVREMTRARAAPSAINGREVVVLERVVTDFDYASESHSELEDDDVVTDFDCSSESDSEQEDDG